MGLRKGGERDDDFYNIRNSLTASMNSSRARTDWPPSVPVWTTSPLKKKHDKKGLEYEVKLSFYSFYLFFVFIGCALYANYLPG